MKSNNIFAVLICGLFIALVIGLMVACDSTNGIGTETETYYKANDGEYLPIYRITTTAIRIDDCVEVEYNGNLYSAHLSPESEIQTGDRIVALFTMYEGELQFVGIN